MNVSDRNEVGIGQALWSAICNYRCHLDMMNLEIARNQQSMPNLPKQPGDAVLTRDGIVKLNGKNIGVWWRDDYHWHHFAEWDGGEPLLSTFFRHELRSAIPQFLLTGSNKIRRQF